MFTYTGPKANTIIKTMNNSLKRFLPDNVKRESHMQVKNLVPKSRLKIKQKINTNSILFITVNVQNQLVMKII